jgi:hypothetical protein
VRAKSAIRDNEINAFQKYKSVMGEVEARNTQKRAPMSPSDRATIPPNYTEDTPRSEQIVRPARKDGGAVHRAKNGYAAGGGISTPWYERTAARDIFHAGLIHSAVPGRTDKIGMNVKAGSYVVPADIVSGMGQGNTLAGSKKISNMFTQTNPLTLAGHFHSPPIKAPKMAPGLAHGGKSPTVPIIAAGGEHVITPEELVRKYGSLAKGHAEWDHIVVSQRKKHRKTLANLPGPKK